MTFTWFAIMAACGMFFGAASCVLCLAQLTCEHSEASRTQRLTTFALGLCAAWTGFDCWDALAGISSDVDSKAVAFTVALALSWGYRRVFRIGSTQQPNVTAQSL